MPWLYDITRFGIWRYSVEYGFCSICCRDACCNPCRGLNRNGKVSAIGVVICDSIAVNGVCLTVIEIENESFTADVSQETLNCSIFGDLSLGDAINLEKALRLNQGIDGHLVSGHVDGQGEVTDIALEGESMRFRINVALSI
jgi:riboflavin synthase alpha subunit